MPIRVCKCEFVYGANPYIGNFSLISRSYSVAGGIMEEGSKNESIKAKIQK